MAVRRLAIWNCDFSSVVRTTVAALAIACEQHGDEFGQARREVRVLGRYHSPRQYPSDLGEGRSGFATLIMIAMDHGCGLRERGSSDGRGRRNVRCGGYEKKSAKRLWLHSFLGAISDEFHTRYESEVTWTGQAPVVASLRLFKVDLEVDLHNGETLPFVGSSAEPVHDRRNASVWVATRRVRSR